MSPPLAPTPRGWALLAIAAALAAAHPFAGLRDLWFLSLVVAALVAVSLATAAAIGLLARFRVRVTVADPTPTVGETIDAEATVSHRLPFTRALDVLWTIDDERAASPLVVAPRDEARTRRAAPARRRGRARVRVNGLRLLDPLGLARWNGRVSAGAEVVVLPRAIDGWGGAVAAGEAAGAAAEPSGTGRLGGAGTPEGALREYRAGDALRQVHWKQSARQGELLVNLAAADSPSTLSLMLVASADAHADDASFERAVSAAASIGRAALGRGRQVRLRIGPHDPEAITSAAALLRALALAERTGGTTAAVGPGRHGDAVVVTGRLTGDLAETLASARGGTLVVADADDASAPPQWRVVAIPRGAAAHIPPPPSRTPLGGGAGA